MLIKLEEGKRYRVTLEGFYYETKLQGGEIILRTPQFRAVSAVIGGE